MQNIFGLLLTKKSSQFTRRLSEYTNKMIHQKQQLCLAQTPRQANLLIMQTIYSNSSTKLAPVVSAAATPRFTLMCCSLQSRAGNQGRPSGVMRRSLETCLLVNKARRFLWRNHFTYLFPMITFYSKWRMLQLRTRSTSITVTKKHHVLISNKQNWVMWHFNPLPRRPKQKNSFVSAINASMNLTT
jgi:hypothetical protein